MILKHNRNWSSLLWSSWLCFWLGTWEWSRIGSPCTWVPFPYDLCLCEENFEEIQQLISQIKRKEIIATTAEPQTTTSVQGLIHKETDRRKSIHEDRLTQYLEMAKRSGIPRQSSDHLDRDTEDLAELRALRQEVLSTIRLCVAGSNNRAPRNQKSPLRHQRQQF